MVRMLYTENPPENGASEALGNQLLRRSLLDIQNTLMATNLLIFL